MSIFLGVPAGIYHSTVSLSAFSAFSITSLLELLVSGSLVSILATFYSRGNDGESLPQDAKLFSAFMDNLPAFAWIKDLEGHYVYCNKLTLARLQPFQSDWLGKTDADLWPGELGRSYRANDLKVVATRQTLEAVETCLLEGEQRHLLVSKFPIFNQTGDVIMVGGIGADITAHQRAEDALHKAEKKYRDIFENAVEGIFQSTPDGHFVTTNPAMARMLGYDSPEELLSSRTDIGQQHYVEPAVRLRFKQMLEEDGVVRDFEHRAYRKNGRKIWLSENVRSVCDADGLVLYYEGFTEDITERKGAEESLNLFRSLTDQSNDAIEVLHPTTLRFLDCNTTAHQTLGYTREEFLRLSAFDIDPVIDQSKAARLADEMVTSDFVIFESIHQRKDGSTFPVEINAKTIRLERDYRLAVVRDITERKRAENALQESEERFRQLSEAAFEAIILHDQGTILEVNQSFCRHYGYERAEVIGKSVLELALPEFRELLLQRMRSGNTGPYEGPALRKDGTTFNAEVAGKPIHYQGRTVRVAAIRDITEQKRNERRRAAQYAVTRVLAESATLTDAIPKLLRVICESLHWKMGEFWRVCNSTNLLRRVETWHVPTLDATSFIEASRQNRFAFGAGLPGRVWQSGRPAWIADAMTDPSFASAALAAKVGLRGAVAFPILLGNHILGVMLFFSRRAPEVDEDLLKMMSAIGSQIGQFTDRKRAEEALRESEERYRIVSETASEAIITIDESSTILFVNPATEQTFGYTAKEMLGEQLTMLMPQDMRHVHKAGLNRYAETRRKHIFWEGTEFMGRHKSGQEIPLEVSFSEAMKNGHHYFTGIARDVTKRKRAEEALRQSEREYRGLFENAHDAILIIQPDREIILEVNQRACEIYGYSRSEFIGMSLETISKNVEQGRMRIKETLERGTCYEFETIQRRADGTEMFLTINASVVEYKGQLAIQSINRDVTERKRAEELLQTFPRRLIEAQEDERKRIARELHDEIGQVLTAVTLNLQAVRAAGLAPTFMPKIDESILVVEHALQQVQNLSLELRPSLLDDLGLATAIRWFVDRYAQRTGVKTEVVTDAPIAGGRFSRELETACFRIVQEALTNVARHAEATTVAIHLGMLGEEICISIKDDGVGFDTRAGNDSAPFRLGLRGMEERTLALGGKLEIKSAPASGTEILAYFPNAKKKN